MKMNSISVGYNCEGQKFFDLLISYKPFIHSYFFNCFHGLDWWDKYDINKFLQILKSSNTYNIPANILFNYKRDESLDQIKYFVEFFINLNINLKAITLCSPDICEKVRNIYPGLQIHYSCHSTKSVQDFDNLIGIVDVINLSSVTDFNNFQKISDLKAKGFLIKYILNKGCIPNRELTYKKLSKNYPEIACEFCEENNQLCFKLFEEFPWLKLSRGIYYSEFLKYFDTVDIWKLTSRQISTEDIKQSLQYYILNQKTSKIFDVNLNDKSYQTFLEWIQKRLKCNGLCNSCDICKKYWEIIVNAS